MTSVSRIIVHKATDVEPNSDSFWTCTRPTISDELILTNNENSLSEISTHDESPAEKLSLEIESVLIKGADRRNYIRRTDLTRLASPETIRRIIMEDVSMKKRTLEWKESFSHEVQQSARILFAICIYLTLQMGCLRELLDRSLSDRSLPLDFDNCCHKRECGGKFRGLVATQGSFMAPVFAMSGEHQSFPSCVVLPIEFVPKEHPTETPMVYAKGVSPPTENEEQVALRKDLALCGSGAYSRVYRVRIDPDHHGLSEVTKFSPKFCLRDVKQA